MLALYSEDHSEAKSAHRRQNPILIITVLAMCVTSILLCRIRALCDYWPRITELSSSHIFL